MSNSLHRFSAKLLFQYRVGSPGDSKFRTCEERIVTFQERNASVAFNKAKKMGKDSEESYTNDEGERVHIEFVGLCDFMQLGIESEPNEVWYEIKTMLRPMERKGKLLPDEKKLLARVMKSNPNS